MRKRWVARRLIVVVALLLVVAAVAFRPHGSSEPTRAAAAEGDADAAKGGEAEAEGEDPEAEAEAHVGVPVTKAGQSPITAAEARAMAPAVTAPGWAGEIKLGVEDTWEPTIAADPSAPYVYAMYNRFGGPKACNKCPGIPMYVRVSSDNGVSWGPETYLCQCSGVKWQYDPVLKVASNGAVYATFMNGNDMMFSKSTNHAVHVEHADRGVRQAVGGQAVDRREPERHRRLHRATRRRPTCGSPPPTTAGPRSRRAVKLNTDTGRYRYPNGLEVLPNGTALLSATSYPGAQKQLGQVNIEIWRTTNGGTSWTRTILASPFTGVTWETSSTTALASDAAGTLVALVHRRGRSRRERPRVDAAFDRLAAPRGGLPIELGAGTANASFPAIAGGATGVFRLDYADNRTGSWNTYYRSSTDGGLTWSAEADISDADAGATYKTAAGYASPYGDYGAIDVTNTGKAVAVWGEGASFSTGPGGIWFNRML